MASSVEDTLLEERGSNYIAALRLLFANPLARRVLRSATRRQENCKTVDPVLDGGRSLAYYALARFAGVAANGHPATATPANLARAQ